MTQKTQKPIDPKSSEPANQTEASTSVIQKVPTPAKIAPAPQKLIAQRMNNPRPKIQQRSPRGR